MTHLTDDEITTRLTATLGAADAPTTVTPDAVLAGGARRARRRTLARTGALAAGLAAVTAGALTLPHLGARTTPLAPAAAPSRSASAVLGCTLTPQSCSADVLSVWARAHGRDATNVTSGSYTPAPGEGLEAPAHRWRAQVSGAKAPTPVEVFLAARGTLPQGAASGRTLPVGDGINARSLAVHGHQSMLVVESGGGHGFVGIEYDPSAVTDADAADLARLILATPRPSTTAPAPAGCTLAPEACDPAAVTTWLRQTGRKQQTITFAPLQRSDAPPGALPPTGREFHVRETVNGPSTGHLDGIVTASEAGAGLWSIRTLPTLEGKPWAPRREVDLGDGVTAQVDEFAVDAQTVYALWSIRSGTGHGAVAIDYEGPKRAWSDSQAVSLLRALLTTPRKH